MALLSTLEICVLLGIGTILYMASLVVYRLWLSPIASFPGPFWAKVTFWNEFYYEWIHPGQYFLRIEEMHQEYGPIVRVTPEEIHIRDADFYNELFVAANVRKTNGYTRYARGTGFEDIWEIIASHEGHKMIRDPVEKLYSKIKANEPLVATCVKNFCDRLNKERDGKEPLNLSHACLSLAIDVATTATFQSPSDYLKEPKFNEKLFDTQKNGLVHVPLFAHLPFLARLFTSPLIEFLASQIPEMRDWDEKTRRQTFRSELEEPAMKLRSRSSLWKRSSVGARVGKLIQQNGIFHVSHTIESVVTYLAMNQQQRQKLKEEISEFWNDHPDERHSWATLRNLPYLTACIYEGLRLGAGSMKRSPRVFPDDEIQYQSWTIPKNTPVSMTTYFMQMDPDVYPEPDQFCPERWMGGMSTKAMHNNLVPFGRGSRACAGQNIAWMQMYFAISQLYKPGGPEIELFESDETDVQLAHGYVFPQPRLDSKGVRVLIHSPDDSSPETR